MERRRYLFGWNPAVQWVQVELKSVAETSDIAGLCRGQTEQMKILKRPH